MASKIDYNSFNRDGGFNAAPPKNTARRLAMDMPPSGVPHKIVFVLPGAQCSDVQTGVGVGSVDPNSTVVIAVERLAENIPDLVKNMAALGFTQEAGNLYLGRTDLCEFDLVEALTTLGKTHVDFAYLDICGDWSIKEVLWLQANARLFTPDARIIITSRVSARQPRFLAAAIKHSSETGGDLFMPWMKTRLCAGTTSFQAVWDESPADAGPHAIKSVDTLMLNAQLLQVAFLNTKLHVNYALMYQNNEGTVGAYGERVNRGKTFMCYLDTTMDGAGTHRAELKKWFDAVLNLARTLPREEWSPICQRYYISLYPDLWSKCQRRPRLQSSGSGRRTRAPKTATKK